MTKRAERPHRATKIGKGSFGTTLIVTPYRMGWPKGPGPTFRRGHPPPLQPPILTILPQEISSTEESPVQDIRTLLGCGFIVLGVACFGVPNDWIMTPAHLNFFGSMPREVWGAIHVVLGALALVSRTSRMATAAMIPTMVTWAGVAYWPATNDQVWNVVSVIAWLTLAGVAAIATFFHFTDEAPV